MTGILTAIMQPPADEVHDLFGWYETEHVPERLAVPGFRATHRHPAFSAAPGRAADPR